MDLYMPRGEIEKIGVKYGVHFREDALELAILLISRYHWVVLSKREGKFLHSSQLRLKYLKELFLELLEIASARLRAGIDSNAEEVRLDTYEYLLRRNAAEIRGATRDKDFRTHAWLLRLKEENEWLCDAKDVEQWQQKQPLATIVHSRQMTEHVERVQDMVGRIIWYGRSATKDVIEHINLTVDNIIADFRQSTCEHFQPGSVTVDTIVQAARKLIGIPPSWVLNSCKPRLQGLRERLCRRIVGQEHIIDAITNALSSPGSCERVGRPMASFLFLNGACFFQNELCIALSKELFDSNNLLIKCDMLDYTDALPSDDSNGIRARKRILDAVRSNPFCVLLLENVDKANKKTVGFLCDILSGDWQKNNPSNEDFSNTLILMTTEVGKNKFEICDCNFVDLKRPIDESALEKMDHHCYLLAAFRQAKMSFGLDLLHAVDDVILFDIMSQIDQALYTRMCLRETIYDMGQEREFIVYASEAAIRSMMLDNLCMEPGGGVALRKWMDEHIVRKLYDMASGANHDGFCIFYIDTLIGTNELSFKLELDDPVEDYIRKDSATFFELLRSQYYREKGLFYDFYNLETLNKELLYLSVIEDTETLACQLRKLKAMDDLISKIFKYKFDEPLCNTDSSQQLLKKIRQEAFRQLKEWEDARGRTRIDGLRTILYNGKAECGALNIITEAFLGLPDACIEKFPRLTKSSALLGLKSELLKSLDEHCITRLKRCSIITINMEDHGDAGSLVQFIGDCLTHPWSCTQGECDLLSVGNWETFPTILVIDQVEKAQTPVFCSLLSILDHGILRSGDGNFFDLHNSMVVMMSNLGRKEILDWIERNISTYPDGIDTGMLTQQSITFGFDAPNAASRFKTVLVKDVDGIPKIDPSIDDQPQKFSSLFDGIWNVMMFVLTCPCHPRNCLKSLNRGFHEVGKLGRDLEGPCNGFTPL